MSNLKKYKEKIIREMEKEEKNGGKRPAKAKKRGNDKTISLLLLFIFSVLIIVISEAVSWYFGQQGVQDKLTEIWNFVSPSTLHRKILFSVQSALPAGHDFSGLANGISSVYDGIGKALIQSSVWLFIVPYAIVAGCIGAIISRICVNRVGMRELFAVSACVFIIKLLSYASPNVNFLDFISVIAFVLNNYFVPLMLFFVCYVSIFVGSEVMVFLLKNYGEED